MSLNAATIAVLIEKGFSAGDIAEFEAATKYRPAPPIPLRLPRSEPLHRRMGSGWRARAFCKIAERDGANCSECGAVDRTIWRQMGCWSGDQWGDEAWECFRYTKVHSTSNLEVDHRKPLSEGGSNDLDNLWLLCVDCHKAKTSLERSNRLKALFAAARV